MVFNISEAKAQLSRLVEMVHNGEKVVIAKNNLPLVDLVPHKKEGKRVLGHLAGKIELPETLMDEDLEIAELFYGDDV
jgi:prevent-host-death family protein